MDPVAYSLLRQLLSPRKFSPDSSMAFILDAQRDADDWYSADRFGQYLAYLETNRALFPKRMYAIASSRWWYGFEIPKAPHDACLKRMEVVEKYHPREGFTCEIHIELESGFGGEIHLTYSRVQAYSTSMEIDQGKWNCHTDWRYDEFTTNGTAGEFVHTIEWGNGRIWTIRAHNLKHRYVPESGVGKSAK